MYEFQEYVTEISLRIVCIERVMSVPAMIEIAVCNNF
jgi:hypothetical protein